MQCTLVVSIKKKLVAQMRRNGIDGWFDPFQKHIWTNPSPKQANAHKMNGFALFATLPFVVMQQQSLIYGMLVQHMRKANSRPHRVFSSTTEATQTEVPFEWPVAGLTRDTRVHYIMYSRDT